MSELLVPSGFAAASAGGGPFDRRFFGELFPEGQCPNIPPDVDGDVAVVELELINGATCDVFCFEAFRRAYMVAQLFVDPPDSEDIFTSFIRYETIFRVNIRYHRPAERKLGFQSHKPEIEPDEDE